MSTGDASRSENHKRLFWQRVTFGDGCWEHRGSLGSHGYPQATGGPRGTSYPAHRVCWLLFVGEVPAGMFVCHRCNNRKCVRPDHLYVGTHKQNMDDMARAGHPNRALTEDQVRRIRSTAEPAKSLASEMRVSPDTIRNVRRGAVYRHVT